MRELSLNVLDVAQNSIAAGASVVWVRIAEESAGPTLTIAIEDNGCGMSAGQLERVQDPFYTTRTTRKVGLGVPLFKMAAEMTGGTFSIASQMGKGTKVLATFCAGHIDMTPLGEIDETMRLLLTTAKPGVDFVYTHSRDAASFTLDTRELRGVLGDDILLSDPDIAVWIKEYLAEQSKILLEGTAGNNDA